MFCKNQWQFLNGSVELGRLSHAYLFCGQHLTEIKKIAYDFIELINGPASDKGFHPDIFLIEPKDREIKISQIRELKNYLSLKTYSAPFKTAIIDRAHLLNQEAQSALLKLLEEPRGQTLILLITPYPEMLLPTILSRVERIKFYSPPTPYQKEKIEELLKITEANLAQRFQYAKKLSESSQDLHEILENWMKYFREKLLANPNQPKIFRILKTIQTIHFLLFTTNINSRLALEIVMLEF